MKRRTTVPGEFAVSSWHCTFDKRRGEVRVLNVWIDAAGFDFAAPDLSVYVSSAGRVRVFQRKGGKMVRVRP